MIVILFLSPQCTDQWFTILQQLVAAEIPDVQHRGTFILANMMAASKDIAQRLVESSMLELLMALAKLEEPEKQKTKECAENALAKAVEWELIKPKGDTAKTEKKKTEKKETTAS